MPALIGAYRDRHVDVNLSLREMTSVQQIDALNAGQLHGIIVQNPFNMGYLGVRTMVDSLMGKPVEKKIDTGVMLVTKDNLQTPEVNDLLHPPLDQYLK